MNMHTTTHTTPKRALITRRALADFEKFVEFYETHGVALIDLTKLPDDKKTAHAYQATYREQPLRATAATMANELKRPYVRAVISNRRYWDSKARRYDPIPRLMLHFTAPKRNYLAPLLAPLIVLPKVIDVSTKTAWDFLFGEDCIEPIVELIHSIPHTPELRKALKLDK